MKENVLRPTVPGLGGLGGLGTPCVKHQTSQTVFETWWDWSIIEKWSVQIAPMKTWVSKTFRTCEVITYNSVLAACDSLSDLLWEGPWEIEHAAMWLLTLESKEDAAYLFWCLRHIFSAIFIWTSFAAVDALLMLSRSQLAACFATTANNAKGDDGGRCYQWLGI